VRRCKREWALHVVLRAPRVRQRKTHRLHFGEVQAQQAVHPGEQFVATHKEALAGGTHGGRGAHLSRGGQAARSARHDLAQSRVRYTQRVHSDGGGAEIRRPVHNGNFVPYEGTPSASSALLLSGACALLRHMRGHSDELGGWPSVSPSRGGGVAQGIVALTNRALAQAGLAVRVRSAEAALSVCANTSVLVAATEAALGEALDGVQRQPRTAAERAHNVEAVVNALASKLLNWVRTRPLRAAALRLRRYNLRQSKRSIDGLSRRRTP